MSALKAEELRDSANTYTAKCDSAVPYSFNASKLIAPVALTAAGAIGISAFKGFRHGLRDDIQRCRGNYWHGDDYIQYVPVASYLALGLCGVPSRTNFRDRVIVAATASLCMAAVVNVTKTFVNEKRPNSDAVNSFPSGHSATAFMGAELVRIGYGNAIGAAAYVVAAGVGALRLYNDRHWYNDVLAGAGIGILSARIAYWILPFEKRLFRLDRCRRSESASIMPYYSPATRAAGVSMAVLF